MALRHEHDHPEHEGHDPNAFVATSTVREPVGAAQVVSVATGVFFVVVGAIGLARTGTSDLTGSQATVAGLGMTGLLALVHIGIGLLAALGATTRPASRGTMLFLGPALIAMGIIALVEPVRRLGWNDATAIAYLIVGGVALAGALFTPILALRERVAERRVVSG